jgi:hypothetical protein
MLRAGGAARTGVGPVGLGRRVSVEAVAAHLGVERAPVDSQTPGGELLVAVGLMEGLDDALSLEIAQRSRHVGGPGALPQRGRQVLPLDHLAPAEHDQALDDVLDLSHVAGPGIVHQGIDDVRSEPLHATLHAPGILAQEVLGESRDVLAALPERRQVDRDDVQAVVEVAPEAPAVHRLLEVAVRGGEEARVGLESDLASHALEGPFLEDAEEEKLCRWRDLPDLVEEQGTAAGQLETPLLQAGGTGEGAPFVPEELAVQDPLGVDHAVRFHEGPVPAARGLVDGPRDEALSGPAFSREKHRGFGSSDLAERLDEPPDRGRASDDPPEGIFLAQPPAELHDLEPLALQLLGHSPAFLARLAQVDGPVGDVPEGVGGDRLHHEVIGTLAEGGEYRLDGRHAGEHHHQRRRPDPLDLLKNPDAVRRREREVGQDEIEAGLERPLDGLRSGRGRIDLVARLGEDAGVGCPDVLVVVGDEDPSAFLRHPRSPPSWSPASSH